VSIVTLVRRSLRRARHDLRAATIRRLESDIDWARASFDTHIAGLEAKLDELRRAQRAELTAQDIARGMDRRAKGVA